MEHNGAYIGTIEYNWGKVWSNAQNHNRPRPNLRHGHQLVCSLVNNRPLLKQCNIHYIYIYIYIYIPIHQR